MSNVLLSSERHTVYLRRDQSSPLGSRRRSWACVYVRKWGRSKRPKSGNSLTTVDRTRTHKTHHVTCGTAKGQGMEETNEHTVPASPVNTHSGTSHKRRAGQRLDPNSSSGYLIPESTGRLTIAVIIPTCLLLDTSAMHIRMRKAEMSKQQEHS